MSFNGSEGDFISLEEAAAMTASYREANPSGTQGYYLGKTKLLDLLNQTGCKGLRIYHGVDGSTGATDIVVVGVDSSENDILDSTGPLILDRSMPCPPNCGNNNALNS